MNKACLTPLIVLLAAAPLAAQEAKKTWAISSELGIILTSGNTESSTLKGAITAKQELERWRNEYKLETLYKKDEVSQDDGSKDNKRTSERYFASVQGNYKLNEEHSYLFIYGSHLSDYFGAYRNESVFSVGYGQRLLKGKNYSLDGEIGPGYKYFEYAKDSAALDSDGDLLAGSTDGEMIALGKLNFNWDINEFVGFRQSLALEHGSTNTKSRLETELVSKLSDAMQMKLGFYITHNSDVADDKENTDTETLVTLIYNF
ncbi:DUF481 domain-containing protein [Thalassomonas haliotis]|uniref:DUF481 domain-containing protein n=1 Tax=Thalassomonas haliotis TaxID=485448 RepID=A0ABY7VJE2_9GAMM|nr:DUF481 domain-containing protein [Thalassomonas haliotis]WDE12792.1 DUF481 domain-containing protein [Thalassomonas haliotis]